MRVTTCNYLVSLHSKYDRLRTAWEKVKDSKNGHRAEAERLSALMQPILMAEVEGGRARCKADADAPFQNTLSLDQIAKTFGITRPRVQQLEARARAKIMGERATLGDYLVESDPERKEEDDAKGGLGSAE
jgi:DNA-directed RNA polymerase sigma subunit (sigma70/sigma32)